MTIYTDNLPSSIEAPQKLYIQYSHDINFDYSTGRYPDGTEVDWHWENVYIPISHSINGLVVGKHEWMRIKIGDTNYWTYPIRMSANVTNIETIQSEVQEGESSFIIKITFSDGSTKESEPIIVHDGQDGIGISSAIVNESGYLILTYSDGSSVNVGKVKGEDGTSFPTGPDDYILSTSAGIPVWISPTQVINTALSANLPLTYNMLTGEFSINKADTDTDGYLSSDDWDIFNNKEDSGIAQGLINTHESTYNHLLIATALQTETDPIFSAWLSTTPPLYSETDPIFNSWLSTTPPSYPGHTHSHNSTTGIEGGDIVTPHYYHSDQPINIVNDVEFNSVKSTILNSTEAQRGTDSHFGSGVPDAEKKKFKIGYVYNSGNITMSISFVGAYTEFFYYINNKKFIVNAGNIAAYTQTVAKAEGIWFFYIDQSTTNANTPIITLSQTPWGITNPDVLLWNGYFNASRNVFTWIGHEKHTYGRDLFNHARNHAQGALYQSGLLLSAYNGLTNAQLQSNTDNNFGRGIFQIAGGYFFDEDLKNGIAHSDTAVTAISPETAETDWDKFVYQFLGFTAIATTGTNATTIVFPTSRTLVAGQAITVMNGNTTTIRGTTTITTGGTGTSFTVASVTGLASGDAIVVGARIPIYYIDSVSGSTYIWRKLTATSFTGVTSQASTWTRSTTTITVTFNNHGMNTGELILVSVSSDTGAIPLGLYTITRTGTNTFTIVGIDTGGASGTLTYNNAFNASTIASGVPQFNNATSGRFSPCNSVRYFPIYLAATNFISEPVIAILGQGQSTNNNLTTALSEAPFQYNNLLGLSGLNIQEIVPFYRLSFRYDSGAGQNANRMRLVDATFLDVRVSTSSGAILSGGGVTDHALLSNRGWVIAGHTGTAYTLASFGASGEAIETSALEVFSFAASDEITAITTGTAKITGHWPYAFTAISMFVGLTTTSSSGNVTLDMNDKNGNTIFSTRPTVLQGELTSLTNGTQPVLSTTSFAKGDKWTIDFDLAGTGATGVKVYLIGLKS